MKSGKVTYTIGFLSTPSARRATRRLLPRLQPRRYFYPRPPRGGRQLSSSWIKEGTEFLSTPSARRATLPPPSASSVMCISIHALREEGDLAQLATSQAAQNISIHALREEGDRMAPTASAAKPIFLSTPSARRATDSIMGSGQGAKNFYPRPPRGGRHPNPRGSSVGDCDFYPRPPRGGRPQNDQTFQLPA